MKCEWFTLKNHAGMEIVFMTDKLVYFYYHKTRNTTIIKTTTNSEHEFPGDQRREIEVALGMPH